MLISVTAINTLCQAPRRLCRVFWASIPSSIWRTSFNFGIAEIYRRTTTSSIRVQRRYAYFMCDPPRLLLIKTLPYPLNGSVKCKIDSAVEPRHDEACDHGWIPVVDPMRPQDAFTTCRKCGVRR